MLITVVLLTEIHFIIPILINGSTFAKRYKDALSGFRNWEQREHAADWILLPQNVGTEHGIDETSLQGELYTILHNKEGHGRKETIVAAVKGINPADVLKVLMQLPEEKRMQVSSVTMDLSDCIRAITREAFPDAIAIRDCFHVVKQGGETCEEIRLCLKRKVVTQQNKEKSDFQKHLKLLASQRKAYRERMKKSHGGKWRKSKCGKKPKRLNTRFVPSRLANGETLIEALTRCKKQLSMSRDKWRESQEARAKILFDMYPKLKEAYNLINSLRAIFRDKNLDKETARLKLKQWYEKVAACSLREVKSVRDTIQFYENEILNYFINRQTNASSESFNSMVKDLRNQVKGVLDTPFFMYRLATVFG